MPTMILKQEVEATPELVSEQLKKFAAATANDKFPYEAGQLLKMNDAYLKGVNALPGMPVLVITASPGTQLGMIALYKTDGNITVAFVSKNQVEGIWA